jgi:hypothetical protein
MKPWRHFVITVLNRHPRACARDSKLELTTMNNHEKRLAALEAEADRKGYRGALLTGAASMFRVGLINGSEHVVEFGSVQDRELRQHGTLGGVMAIDADDFKDWPPLD